MSTRQRLEFTAACGGAFFAILVVVAFLIARPSSSAGVDVVAYYSTHRGIALTPTS